MSASTQSNVPLVFIHGIKGSKLVDEKGSTVWISAFQATNLASTPHIELPIQWENNLDYGKEILEEHTKAKAQEIANVRFIQQRDGIKPKSILKTIARVKVYDRWLKIAKSLGRPFHQFTYDWRRDLNETVILFQTFLEEISAKYNSPVQVVAHSMGGLITYATMNDARNIHLFHSVVFAGVPFTQGIGFLHDMHVGKKTGMNSKILDQKVLFTLPSVYTFFPFNDNPKIFVEKEKFEAEQSNNPSNGPTASDVHPILAESTLQSDLDEEDIHWLNVFLKDNPHLQTLPMDFYNPLCWKNLNLGIYSLDYKKIKWTLPQGKTMDDLDEVLQSHLARCLHQSAHFRTRIKFNPELKYPPIATLASKDHQTVVRIWKGGPKSVGGYDLETLPKDIGDGRVPYVSSKPPKGVPIEEFTTDRDHGYLLDDPIIIEILAGLLEKATIKAHNAQPDVAISVAVPINEQPSTGVETINSTIIMTASEQ